jgi:hypothetical protein
MSNSYVDQVTLDCLLNKAIMGNYVMKQKEKQIHKEELEFYKERLSNLFHQLISYEPPEDLPPDIKYTYHTFVKSTIDYFKTVDNNDMLQEEYKYIDMDDPDNMEEFPDDIKESVDCDEANKLLMKSVKMDIPTLDKYVTKKSVKQNEDITFILPKTRGAQSSINELV